MKARRIQVVAFNRNKEEILQHLQKNGFRQVKSEYVSNAEYDTSCNGSINEVATLLNRLDNIIGRTTEKIDHFSLPHLVATFRRLSGKTALSDSIIRAKGKKTLNVDAIEARLNELEKRISEIEVSRAERLELIFNVMPYSHLNIPFSTIKNTQHAKMMLGLLPSNKIFDLTSESQKYPLCNIVLMMSETNYRRLGKKSAERGKMVVFIVGLNGYDELVSFAEGLGMTHCSHQHDEVPIDLIKRLRREVAQLDLEQQHKTEQLIDCFHAIKQYIKYLKNVQSNLLDTAGTIVTEQTFFVEGVYPLQQEQDLLGGLYAITSNLEVIYKN